MMCVMLVIDKIDLILKCHLLTLLQSTVSKRKKKMRKRGKMPVIETGRKEYSGEIVGILVKGIIHCITETQS